MSRLRKIALASTPEADVALADKAVGYLAAIILFWVFVPPIIELIFFGG